MYYGGENEPVLVEGERKSELEPCLNDVIYGVVTSIHDVNYRHLNFTTAAAAAAEPLANVITRKFLELPLSKEKHSPDLFLMLHIKSLST